MVTAQTTAQATTTKSPTQVSNYSLQNLRTEPTWYLDFPRSEPTRFAKHALFADSQLGDFYAPKSASAAEKAPSPLSQIREGDEQLVSDKSPE